MQQELRRSVRAPLTVPIAYRPTGSDEWMQSHTLNVSEGGVLFGPTSLDVGRSVEVIFSIPAAAAALAAGTLFCVGEVVRTNLSGIAAARFKECRFLLDG
jgi:hypothetical protein